jgi:hypothetical protein
MVRVGPKGYLLTENFYIGFEDDFIALIMVGGRTVTKKVGVDYGLFIPLASQQERIFPIPWLGITVPFGKKY